MKKAEDIINSMFKETPFLTPKYLIPYVAEAIKIAQIDAIEEAVKRCADEAETCLDINYVDVVDEQSILNVAKQLRKEIE